jgi:hypothetical protein
MGREAKICPGWVKDDRFFGSGPGGGPKLNSILAQKY